MEEWTIKDLIGISADAVLTFVLFKTMQENQSMRAELSGWVRMMIDAMLQAQKERHALYSQLTARNLDDDIKNAS